ncbi:MAG: cupin domain-containing protein [Rhodospirillaceae bacterium]
MSPATAKVPSAHSREAIYSSAASPDYVQGRRDFFKYRELAESDGEFRAQVVSTRQGMTEPTGWHYHVCGAQFIYILNGTLDLDLEDGRSIHMMAGDSLYIPGGMKHNETSTSDDVEILEVMMPKLEETVPCDAPT